MSDRDLATYYIQSSRFDTTREIQAHLARMKGRRLPLAGRLVRKGLRSILAQRKAV